MTVFVEQVLPYAAFAVFVVGMALRMRRWLRVRVPFALTLFPAPTGAGERFATIAGELLSLRSLLREDKLLWVLSWVLHASLFGAVVGHVVGIHLLRAQFTVLGLSRTASEVLSHALGGAVGAAMALSVGALLCRRIARPELRALSGPGDYLPLALLLAIAVTGLLVPVSAPSVKLEAVRTYLGGLLTLRPIPLPPNRLLFLHVLLVNSLLIYFPFSRLVHSVGFFFARAMLAEPPPTHPGGARSPRSDFATTGRSFVPASLAPRAGREGNAA